MLWFLDKTHQHLLINILLLPQKGHSQSIIFKKPLHPDTRRNLSWQAQMPEEPSQTLPFQAVISHFR